LRKAARRAGEAMEAADPAAWSATVAEGGNLVAEARGLVVGDERLDLLLHMATERKDAQEQAAVAKAAAASKAAAARAEALGISPATSVSAKTSMLEDEHALRTFVEKISETNDKGQSVNGHGHTSWNPNGHHTGGLAIRLFDLKCGDEKCIELCALLPTQAEQLSSLSLFGNDISAAGARALLAVLPQLARLKYLDVQGNRLGADMLSKLKAAAPAGCKVESKDPGPQGDGPCGTQTDWEGAPRVLGNRLVDAVRDLALPANSQLAPPGWPGPPSCVCTVRGEAEFNKCKYCVKAFVARIRKENPRWSDSEVNFRTVRAAIEQVPEEAIPPPRARQKTSAVSGASAHKAGTGGGGGAGGGDGGAAAAAAGADGGSGSAEQLHAVAPTCLHVGGLEGALEDEAALATEFGKFGSLLAVTVRIRREGKKVSWALVSFNSVEEAEKCLAGTSALGEKFPGLVTRHVDEQQALQSKGQMGQVMSRHIQARMGKMLAAAALR
jgi:hypothetical protein